MLFATLGTTWHNPNGSGNVVSEDDVHRLHTSLDPDSQNGVFLRQEQSKDTVPMPGYGKVGKKVNRLARTLGEHALQGKTWLNNAFAVLEADEAADEAGSCGSLGPDDEMESKSREPAEEKEMARVQLHFRRDQHAQEKSLEFSQHENWAFEHAEAAVLFSLDIAKTPTAPVVYVGEQGSKQNKPQWCIYNVSARQFLAFLLKPVLLPGDHLCVWFEGFFEDSAKGLASCNNRSHITPILDWCDV